MREPTESEKKVFGADVKIGEDGNPIEQGFGSLANPDKRTHNEAIKRLEEVRGAVARGVSADEMRALLLDVVRPGMTDEEISKAENNAKAEKAKEDAKDKLIADLQKRLDALEQKTGANAVPQRATQKPPKEEF